MMKISYFVLGLVLAVFVDYSHQWEGNVCSRTICSYRRVRVCSYRTWNACCAWKWVWVPNYSVQYFCCAGWTTSSYRKCDRAICNPSCKNGGTCVRPNVCRCNDGAIGSSCNTLVCNYQRPCFPGTCTPSSSVPTCTCATGFEDAGFSTSDYCRRLEPDQRPEIFEAQARMSFWQRGTGMPTMEKYALYVDSTMSDEVDVLWTNRKIFNWLNVTASAQYVNSAFNDTMPPNFISNFGVGIAKAEAQLLLEKTPIIGDKFISLNMTIPCSPEVSDNTPTSDTYYCNISKPNFDRSLENGDNLTITFKVWSGGYRSLQEITRFGATPRGSQIFEGHLSEKAMRFRFDFNLPTHPCIQSPATCSPNTMLHMDQDITRNSIELRWSDWSDVVSGMFRYSWEVFKLQVDGNLVLREPDPLGPISGPNEVMHNSSASGDFSATYTPPEPGVYSFILEASDRANNSVFVRRIVIYDPSSSVTIDTADDKRLFVSSANPYGDFHWQDPNEDLQITWTNHFVNLVHERGKWLNQVLAYPPQLEENLKNIDQTTNKDDHEGQRTVDEIPNRREIVKFEIARQKDSNGGQSQTAPTAPGEWTDVFLNQTHTIDTASLGGLTGRDTVTVWVRATDAMGNTLIDSTKVSFDDSPPRVDMPKFNRDVKTANVNYSSTIDVTALDMESGMVRVNFMVFKTGKNDYVSNFSIPLTSIPQSECGSRPSCYCINGTTTDCYEKDFTLAISNCWLWVEKELGDSQSVDVRMGFMNMAGLITEKTIIVNDVGKLNGTRTHLGPVNLKATHISETTATLTWSHSRSCYTRTEMWINYRNPNGQMIKQKLHHSATSYNLAGLEPGTTYVIELISQYGGVMSDPVPLPIDTVSAGLSTGAIVGLVIGLLLLLAIILVVVGLVLFKLGLLAGLMSRRNKYVERRPEEAPITTTKQNNRVSRWAFENTTYNKDEEIYIYGSMDLGEPWYVPPDDLTLMEEIATGRFAKIYKAKWRETPKNVREVAAKVLKVRESEDDIMLMMAKINFFSTQVGEHRNIIGFLGAVMDNDALGPVMVMEYCETGPLDKWLQKKRSSVSEDVLDRIQTFALEIARAMEFLASKGVVHRKLAARNCLLTFLLEVKVIGFGPCKSDEGDDSKGDRIPIKWTAPECLKSLKNANEKSDAWSYGVTMWEIFSMGGNPYSDIRGRDLPTKVKTGYRMSRPEYAEDIHYGIMQDCWSDSPAKRPNFRDIVAKLESSFGLRPDGGDQNYYYQR